MARTSKTTNISESEWEVMSVVWDLGSATAREVIARLSKSKDWHPRTIKTLLGRLATKGALRHESEGNRYRYFPSISRQDAVDAETDSFVRRMFGGRTSPLLVHFVQDSDLSTDDIDELRRLLDEKV